MGIRNFTIIPLAALALALSACRRELKTAPGQPPVPVTAGVAETRDMPVFLRGVGTVQPYNSVLIKSRVDGQILKVEFVEGGEVKAGDPLFEIDPRPYQAALAQVLANRRKDEALLANAQSDMNRVSDLLQKGLQTQQSYDQQKALVGQLSASVAADQAQIETARLNLEYADIRSPIAGRTGARLVDAGNLVRAADNGGLVMIEQLRPIFVSFTLPQDVLETLRGSAASGPVEVQALTEGDNRRIATGRLSLIDNRIDESTGTIHLKAAFANGDEALWPGELINVRLVTEIRKQAVTVPARAVQEGPDGSYLFVIRPDMTVTLRAVEVAEVEQGLAAIGKGLAAGERIVVDGQYRLEPGTRVAPSSE